MNRNPLPQQLSARFALGVYYHPIAQTITVQPAFCHNLAQQCCYTPLNWNRVPSHLIATRYRISLSFWSESSLRLQRRESLEKSWDITLLFILVRYRSQAIFSLGRWSSRLPTELHVFRGTRELLPGRVRNFAYGTVTLFGGPFQRPSTISSFDNFPGYTLKQPHNPASIARYGLGCSPFARRY